MATFTSVQNGNLQDGATWGKNSPGVKGTDYPGNADVMNIEHVVTYNAGWNTVDVYGVTTIKSGGVLTFPTDSSSRIQFGIVANNLVVQSGGEFRMGTEEAPILAPHKCQLAIAQGTSTRNAIDVLAGGKFSMFGDANYYGGQRSAILKRDWSAGKVFYVEGDYATKWNVGDQIWIARHNYYSSWQSDSYLLYISAIGPYDDVEDETPITIVENAPGVLFSRVEEYSGELSIVVNLSRNVEMGDFGCPRNSPNPSYSQRWRILVRQTSAQNNIKVKDAFFLGMVGVFYSLAAATTERFNVSAENCTFFNISTSAAFNGITDFKAKNNTYCGVYYAVLNGSTHPDYPFSDGDFFISGNYPLSSIAINSTKLIFRGCYMSIQGTSTGTDSTIDEIIFLNCYTGISGSVNNMTLKKAVFVRGTSPVSPSPPSLTGNGNYSLKILDLKMWYPTSTAINATHSYFKGMIRFSGSNSLLKISNCVVDLDVHNDLVANSASLFYSGDNIKGKIKARNFGAAFNSVYQVSMTGELIDCGRTGFIRNICYDIRFSGLVDGVSGEFFYGSTNYDILFTNTKILNVNSWFRLGGSQFVNPTIKSRGTFEQCNIEGVDIPLLVHTNAGDFVPITSSHAAWQNPPSSNAWIFQVSPAYTCGFMPNQTLQLQDECRIISGLFCFTGVFKLIFKVYPVGWASEVTAEDLHLVVYYKDGDKISRRVVNYEISDEEVMPSYANNGWRDVLVEFNNAFEGMVHYNVEVTRYEAGAYILLDPAATLEAVV